MTDETLASLKSSANLMAHRRAYIRALLKEARRKHEFANGYRAGLQEAADALDGRTISGVSIDPPPKSKGRQR